MEAGSQLASGGITDLGAIGEAALEGAILAAVVPSAAAGSIGRLLNAAKRLKTKPKAGEGANKNVKEGIYEFTDTTGKKYCGQSCNVPNRLKQHEKTGKLDPNQSVTTTEVFGGKTAREIAEHKRIQEITGGVPARRSSKVSNKVDPIGPNRRHLLD